MKKVIILIVCLCSMIEIFGQTYETAMGTGTWVTAMGTGTWVMQIFGPLLIYNT